MLNILACAASLLAMHCGKRWRKARVNLLGRALGKVCGKTMANALDQNKLVETSLPQAICKGDASDLPPPNEKWTLLLFGRGINLQTYILQYEWSFALAALCLYGVSYAWDFQWYYPLLDLASMLLALQARARYASFTLGLFSRKQLVALVEYGLCCAVWELARKLMLKRYSTTCTVSAFRIRFLKVERLGGEMYASNALRVLFPIWLVFSLQFGFGSALAVLALALTFDQYQDDEFRKDFEQLTGEEYIRAIHLTHRRIAKYSHSVFGQFSQLDYFYLVFGFASSREIRLREESARCTPPQTSPAPQAMQKPPSLRRLLSGWKHGKHHHHPDGVVGTQSQLFEDANFAPSNYLVFANWDSDAEQVLLANGEELVAWFRPGEILSTQDSDRGAISDYVGSEDALIIKQGDVADCWLLSSLCIVARHPALMQQILPPNNAHESSGRVLVNIFDLGSGEWQTIEIDDRLPCDVDTRLPLFATSRGNKKAFWMSLVEKAFAKLYGSYSKLHIGQVRRALVQLTGGFFNLYSLETDLEMCETGAIWRVMMGKGKLVVLTSKSVCAGNGLRPDHSYAVLDVDLSSQPRLRLFDPWEDENADGLAEEDGTFWIDSRDVLANFKWVKICQIFPPNEYCEARCKQGVWGDLFELQVASQDGAASSAVVYLSLTNRTETMEEYPHISLLVLKGGCSREPGFCLDKLEATTVLASTVRFHDTREVSLEIKLATGQEYTLLPQIELEDKPEEGFRLSCYSAVREANLTLMKL